MAKSAFDLFCTKCNILVEAKTISRGFGQFRNDAVSPLDEVDTEYHGDHFIVALCGRCNSPFLIRESLYGIPGEFETVTNEVVLYPPPAGHELDGLPEPVSRSLEQAHRSFSTASYDACALMCRRALEAVCKNLSASGNNLAQRISDLKVKGHIDEKLHQWAHGVRLLGNEAAHDVETPVTQEDACDILDLTEAVLLYAFTLEKKFQAFQARRSKRQEGNS
jgi:hypothetical protein